MKLSICSFHVRPWICPWTQFCPELFSYSYAHTTLKFIHNVCVHMELRMCNFHDNTIIGWGIVSPWTCNFTKSLLSRALPLHFGSTALKFTLNVSVYMKLCTCNFHVSVRPFVCPWTQFCPELPLLNHSPFCDQNLLYHNALVGGMITFSDSSSSQSSVHLSLFIDFLYCDILYSAT